MARNKLSESRIRTLTKPGIFGDGDGLYLRVRAGGSKNFVFIYRRGDTRVEMGLGGHGQGTAPVSLTLAREKAEAIRQKLARGEDPRGAHAKRKGEPTFADCMESVLEARASTWRNEKHAAQWKMTLRKYAHPLHDMPVASITVADVVECLRPHWAERPETAERLRMRIAAVMDYAIATQIRTAGNPAESGLIRTLLPARHKLTRGHHTATPYAALPAIVERLRASSGVSARAVEFSCLTAARSGEVRGAVWSEIDLDNALWVIPRERMKMATEHRVPLCDRALAILRAQKQMATGELVFGGDRDGRPISDTAMTKALRRASNDMSTLHGLRSSFRDWAGDMTAHPREVCEAALAHVVKGVEGAYRRGDALAKRRALMNDWEKYCEGGK